MLLAEEKEMVFVLAIWLLVVCSVSCLIIYFDWIYLTYSIHSIYLIYCHHILIRQSLCIFINVSLLILQYNDASTIPEYLGVE